MNLEELRALFITRSGRFDLVDEDGKDSGANFFIQAGTRVLDRMSQHLKSTATAFGAVEIGAFKHVFTRCRAIKEVWISDTSTRTKLELCSPTEFYQYFNGIKNNLDVGRPAYYTPINLRATDIKAFESLGQFLQYVRPDDDTYNGIVFNPADGNYVIEIIGLFSSRELSCDLDENFWSVNFPDLLIMAALYKLEVFHRNTAGANDWLAGITSELTMIEMDMVEQLDVAEDMR